MAETHTATLDRIVDGRTAVLLLEDDDEHVEQSEADDERVDQLDVDVTKVPEDGRHEGAVLAVTVEQGALREVEYCPEATRSRQESAQARLDRLSTNLSDRD